MKSFGSRLSHFLHMIITIFFLFNCIITSLMEKVEIEVFEVK